MKRHRAGAGILRRIRRNSRARVLLLCVTVALGGPELYQYCGDRGLTASAGGQEIVSILLQQRLPDLALVCPERGRQWDHFAPYTSVTIIIYKPEHRTELFRSGVCRCSWNEGDYTTNAAHPANWIRWPSKTASYSALEALPEPQAGCPIARLTLPTLPGGGGLKLLVTRWGAPSA